MPTKPSSVAVLARRAAADSTGSTARSGNKARRVLLAALSNSKGNAITFMAAITVILARCRTRCNNRALLHEKTKNPLKNQGVFY
jgi:hypothetical protein